MTVKKNVVSFTDEDIANIRKAQLELLNFLNEICEMNNLKWWLCSGSLLGAIRHHGYIPWDDDIDLCMPREDYNALISIFKNGYYSNNKKYFLQSYASDAKYNFNFCKLRFENSLFKEMSLQKLDIHHGIYIDIYALDHIPDTKLNRFLYNFNCSIVKARRNTGLFLPKEFYKQRSFKGKLLQVLSWLLTFFLTTKRIVRMNEKYLTKTNEKYKSGNKVILNSDLRVQYDSADFLRTDNCRFENTKAKIPSGFDSILTKQYGDYMTPPVISNRKMHHYCVDYRSPDFIL